MPRYIIAHSYGEWSAGTVVECLEAPWLKPPKERTDGLALVYHVSTNKTFTLPAGLLVPPRPHRNGLEQ